MMIGYRRVGALACLLMLSVGACGDDATAPDNGNPPPAQNVPEVLPVLGLGEVPERWTAEVALSGDFAYTTTWGQRGGVRGNAIKIWDVRAADPVLTDSIIVSDAGTLGDVHVLGNLMLVAVESGPGDNRGGVVLFDISNPAAPVQRSRFSNELTRLSGVHTAKLGQVSGRVYAFLSVNPAPSSLVIVDVTNPGQPQQVLQQAMGNPFIHDVLVRDGLLFTALWNSGFTIWDIGAFGGTPASPVQIGQLQTVGGAAHNFAWFHDPQTGAKRWLFVGEEQPGTVPTSSLGAIHVVDLADLANPREVAFFNLGAAGTHNFALDEERGILYAAYYNGGVQVLDISGNLGECPDSARTDTRCNLFKTPGRYIGRALPQPTYTPYVWGVAARGERLYASDMINGLYVLDATVLWD